jgi:hypothetical protein
MSNIRNLKKAKNIFELNKWALKYVKKYKSDKNTILKNISKEVESNRKANKIIRWALLLMTIFFVINFVTKPPEIIHIGEKAVYFGRNARMILNGIIILCELTVLYVFLMFKLTKKRNIVACEQFSRLFEEKNEINGTGTIIPMAGICNNLG